MLVVDGRPIELDAHMNRLAASLEALFGAPTPAGATEIVVERADGIGLGRLRLSVAPNGEDGQLVADVVSGEVDPGLVFPSRDRGVDLRSIVVEGGLGAHKWSDRTLLERAEADVPEAVPLLLGGEGALLEASRGNVFLVAGGALATPPTDGRILPGIARRAAIEVARRQGVEVREAELRLEDLLEAEEVFLTGSVRGVEPARTVDGARVRHGGGITERIAAALRERWLGPTLRP